MLRQYERIDGDEGPYELSALGLGQLDQLTGLSNRHGLANRVEEDPDDIVRTIAIVDCDGLKSVNDTLGHQAGGIYLQACSHSSWTAP